MIYFPTFPLDNIPTIWYALSGKGGGKDEDDESFTEEERSG